MQRPRPRRYVFCCVVGGVHIHALWLGRQGNGGNTCSASHARCERNRKEVTVSTCVVMRRLVVVVECGVFWAHWLFSVGRPLHWTSSSCNDARVAAHPNMPLQTPLRRVRPGVRYSEALPVAAKADAPVRREASLSAEKNTCEKAEQARRTCLFCLSVHLRLLTAYDRYASRRAWTLRGWIAAACLCCGAYACRVKREKGL